MNVLLLDAHTVQAISVARALKRCGCEVFGMMDNRISFGYVSRYIDHRILAPKAAGNDAAYGAFLREYLDKQKIDVIIPLYDDSATFLASNKSDIEAHYPVKCAIEEFGTYTRAHNKEKLMELCRQNGMPHPRTHALTTETLREAAEYVKFPALIKPNISSGARGIVIVNSLEELSQKFESIAKNFGRCTLQEFVDHTGVYFNVMMYRDQNGICRESTIIMIKRYFPLKGGTSCYCEIIEHPHLVEVCGQVLEHIGWQGFADFDVMEEKGSGNLKIIEINPRMPASIHAAFMSGVNYPEMIVRECMGQPLPNYCYRPGGKMRFMGLDVMWFVFSPERFSFRPSWFNFLGRGVFYQDGAWRDPLPMLMGVFSGVLKYLNPNFRRDKLKS